MKLASRIIQAWDALRGRTPRPRRYSSIWDGAQTNRLFSDWFATAMTPDEELGWSLRRLRDRSRDLARNNPIVRRYLGLLAVNVIGPHGITLQAQVKNNDHRVNKMLNDRIEAGWAQWSERPTIDGRLSRVRFEQVALKSVARDGETFVRLRRGHGPFGLALELIDPDLLDEEYNLVQTSERNEIRMGVEIGSMGEPLAYWFWSEPVSAFHSTGSRRRVRVPADEILHLYDPERVHQSRGAPWIASVMADLKMLDAYEEAALVAARIGAAQTFWFTRIAGDGGLPPAADENNRIAMDLEPGQMGYAPEGYEPRAVSPNYPNTDHADFTKDVRRRIATGLQVSYNTLCNDLESVNFSSGRMGAASERDEWCNRHQWWIEGFLTPVYREWLSMALLTGGLVLDSRDPRKFLDVRWATRRWGYVDPLKDTEAGVLSIENGLNSRTRLLAEQGLELEDVFEELAREQKLAKEHGIEIAKAVTASKPMEAEGDDPPVHRNGKLAAILSGG